MFLLRLNPCGASLLRVAVVALFKMADSADVDISPAEVIVSVSVNTPTGDVDRALLRIPYSVDVNLMSIDNTCGPISFIVNLRDLHANLSHGGADDFVFLHGEDDEPWINVVTRNASRFGTGGMFLSVLGKTEAHPERIIPEFDYQYRAIIVIPSEEFMHLIYHLHHFGESVSVHATDVEVHFSTQNETVVHRTELGECVIAGVHPGHPVSWSFSLHFVSVIFNACRLPESVWLLHSDDVPPMLNFPVRPIGNLMLHLH